VFKARMSDISLLKDSVETIAQLIDEGIFKATPEGLTLMAADRAMVAVVDFHLDKSAFDEFNVDGEVTMALNIDNLLQILRRAKAGDTVDLELTPDGSKLKITIIGSTQREFSIPLLDITEGEVPPTDQLEFDAKFDISSKLLEEGVNDADIVSDSVVFYLTENEFIMKTEGDSSTVEMRLKKGSDGLENIILKGRESVRSRYALEYLKKMMKATKISDTVRVKMGKDYPLRMDFVQPGKIRMSFVLAPRVED